MAMTASTDNVVPVDTTSASPAALDTPALLLDTRVMAANIATLDRHVAGTGVVLRPHVKTCKSAPVADRMLEAHPERRITVSTLEEARQFQAAGYRDVMYAVGLAPQKLEEVTQLLGAGVRLAVVIDNAQAALALIAGAARFPAPLRVYIELDVDGERAGVAPDSQELLALAGLLDGVARIELCGVMTHAGGAYHCYTAEAMQAMALQERRYAVAAATRLRAAGHAAPEVSIGSTPTALASADFSGVTELRAGVYVFNDLVMAGLGVCTRNDIALSVLTTVIGSQPSRNTLLIDAGWMALSNDRSTTDHVLDNKLGLVRGADGQVIADDELIVVSANQEHGLVQRRDGGDLDFARFPVGSRLRVLPIHACATAAQFSRYHLVGSAGSERVWPRFGGWGT